jgi:hypothetical protein
VKQNLLPLRTIIYLFIYLFIYAAVWACREDLTCHFSLAFFIEKDERNIEITHAVDKE